MVAGGRVIDRQRSRQNPSGSVKDRPALAMIRQPGGGTNCRRREASASEGDVRGTRIARRDRRARLSVVLVMQQRRRPSDGRSSARLAPRSMLSGGGGWVAAVRGGGRRSRRADAEGVHPAVRGNLANPGVCSRATALQITDGCQTSPLRGPRRPGPAGRPLTGAFGASCAERPDAEGDRGQAARRPCFVGRRPRSTSSGSAPGLTPSILGVVGGSSPSATSPPGQRPDGGWRRRKEAARQHLVRPAGAIPPPSSRQGRQARRHDALRQQWR